MEVTGPVREFTAVADVPTTLVAVVCPLGHVLGIEPNTSGDVVRALHPCPAYSGRRMKASDVDDRAFLAVVAGYNDATGHWCLTHTVEGEFAAFPPKVLQAKARKLIRRGLMDGCACGCRGDYRVTDAGRALLAEADEEEPFWTCPYLDRYERRPGHDPEAVCGFSCVDEPWCVTGGPWPQRGPAS